MTEARSDQGQGQGHLSGNFRAAAPASFGVHRGHAGTKDLPSVIR